MNNQKFSALLLVPAQGHLSPAHIIISHFLIHILTPALGHSGFETKTLCAFHLPHACYRTVPRPRLFALKRRLQNERPQHRQTVFGSSPDRAALSSLEHMQDAKDDAKSNFFFWVKKLQKIRSQTPKTVLVSSLWDAVGCRDNFYYRI